MLEVEIKYAQADSGAVKSSLMRWRARPEPLRREIDRYFNAPDRDFRRTDEALRIRQCGSRNTLTYKGPKIDPLSKTRREIEVPLADGRRAAQSAAKLLTALGYRAVGTVVKRRRVYRLRREGFGVEISLDDVAGLGRFVELEIRAEERRMRKARNALLRASGELGLRRPERRSYLELLLLRKSGGS